MENLKIKKFKFKNFIFIAFITFVFSISFNFVFADESCSCKVTGSGSSLKVLAVCSDAGRRVVAENSCSAKGYTATGSCVCVVRGTGGLVPCVDDCTAEDLFGNPKDYANQPPIWTALIRSALGISGIVILLWFIYGGVLLMISSGDPKKVTKARKIMIESVLGLLIVLFAYTFVKFIVMILAGNNNWKLFFGGR